ncbi:MAG: zinc ribbon domain-containing protein [Clostridiaceae bacterium]|nr:zinc ribbon domain-containing protein [Clostridiaceae bacterium]
MALISCPSCGKEVSDKALACPGCGYDLSELHKSEEPKPVVCEECGTEIPDDATVCPNCGCPINQTQKQPETEPQKVEITNVNLKMKQKSKKIIIISVICVALVAIAAIVASQAKAKQICAEYAENLDTVTYTMLSGASDAESAGNLIKSVWYNTIYEKSDSSTNKYTRSNNGQVSYYNDFNDALQNLFSDSTFKQKIQSISDNQDSVNDMMKKLTNPPEEYKDAYTALKDYYDAYISLTNLAINPTGSLQTYSSSFNSADTDVSNCYQAMQIYVNK